MSKWKTIVVGVDGSPPSRTALTWAADVAADHRAELVVLTVWEHTLLPPMGSGGVPGGGPQHHLTPGFTTSSEAENRPRGPDGA